MRCQVVNKSGEKICTEKAVWLHTYYKSLSVCEEHYQKQAAAKLRAIPSKKRSEASRENGKKGGRPKKSATPSS